MDTFSRAEGINTYNWCLALCFIFDEILDTVVSGSQSEPADLKE